MNDVWSFCDDTVMNLLCTLMFMVICFHCGCCLCPFFLQNSNCLSLFVGWKLGADARVEHVLNKLNEVDAVSLTQGRHSLQIIEGCLANHKQKSCS